MKWVLISWNDRQWGMWPTPEWENYLASMPHTLFREVARSNSKRELEALEKLLYASKEGVWVIGC